MSEPFKLSDASGVILGIVHIPPPLAKVLREDGGICIPLADIPMGSSFSSYSQGLNPTATMSVRNIHFYLLNNGFGEYTVRLHGCTVDEIEKLRGFFFYAGAGYLQSLIRKITVMENALNEINGLTRNGARLPAHGKSRIARLSGEAVHHV